MRSTLIQPACWVGLLLLSASFAAAQAAPSAKMGSSSLWVGEALSRFQPDTGSSSLSGITGLVDYNRGRWGLEFNARFLQFGGLQGESENNYIAGPRWLVGRGRRLRPFVGMLAGSGTLQYPGLTGNGNYLIYAPFGGVEYRLSGRIAARADYQYQFWPGAPGIAGKPSHGITPSGVTVGVVFRLF